MIKAIKKSSNKLIILGTDINLDQYSSLQDPIITFNLAVEHEGQQKGLCIFYVHRYGQSKEVWPSIVSETENWLKTWHSKKISGEKSILDIFKSGDLSLWWLVFDVLWTARNGVLETLYYLKTFSSLLKKYNPKCVETVGQFDYPIDTLLRCFASKYGFDLVLNDFRMADYETTTKPTSKIAYLFRLACLKLLALNQRNYELVVISNSSKVVKQGKRNVIQWEGYLNGLEDFFEENQAKLISHNAPLQSPALNWVGFYPLSLLLKKKLLTKKYRKQILNFEESKEFQDSWIIEGVNIYPLIKNLFRNELPRFLSLAKLELITASKFLKKLSPQVILTTEHVNIKTRALAFASINKKIKVVATQVGYRVATQVGYRVPQISIDGFLIHSGFDKRVLPELYVWGEFYQRLFEGWGYPPSKIKNIGFFITKKKTRKRRDFNRYVLYIASANLTKNKFINPVDGEIFTIRKIRDVLPPNIKLVVKIHPGHPIDIYFKKLDGLKNLSLIGGESNTQIHDLVYNAKIVVGKSSTVLIQAMVMEKPVIAVNFASEVNFMGINDIPFVTNPNELKKILDEILIYKNYPPYDVDKLLSSVGQNAISKIIKELNNSIE